jgi:outer membrane protein OmpA-like peptidoglycan-associated protein
MQAAQAQSASQAPAATEEKANKAEPKLAAAQKDVTPASSKSAAHANQRDEELQKLQQSLGLIAETHRTSSGLVMTLGEKSIRFESGKWDVAPQYRAIVTRIAGVLKTVKGYSIYVYGYTDDNGTKDYNLMLSARRAKAVRDGLVKAGIDPSLITTKGFGKSEPRERGTDAKARAANRRVEIGLTDSSSVPARSTTASKAATTR